MAKVVADSKKKNVNIKYQRDKDRELVKGIFKYHEAPGGSVSFSFRKYKGDPIERYDFVDGHVYTIPLGVAKHLNSNCWYPQYAHIEGEDMVAAHPTRGIGKGMRGMNISRKVRRMSFQSLEFTDIDELDIPHKEIVNVESLV